MLCMRMSPETLELYESLPNVYTSDGSGPLTGIYRSNTRDVGVEDPEGERIPGGGKGVGQYACIGALTSRINHDCSPNTTYTFNMPSFSMEIMAVRSIAKGEEIAVSYAHESAVAAERQASLKPYGFTCSCTACQDPQTSDKARKRAITGLLPKTSQGVEHADSVLAEYEAHGLQRISRYPDLLRRVAKIHRKQGSKERANALDMLADKVTVAQQGRNPVHKDPQIPTFNARQKDRAEALRWIIESGRLIPEQQVHLIQNAMQSMDRPSEE